MKIKYQIPKRLFVPSWEQPIRIPEKVPIEHAEPKVAFAGQKLTWCLKEYKK